MRPSHLDTRYKFDLSPRQREVLELVARGRTNAEIADHLGITLDGAKYHLREILGKLGVESREEAAAAWRASRTPSGRIRQLGFGLAGMRGAPIAWAGAAGAVMAIVAVVVLVAMRQGDSPAAVLSDATPSATVEATARPSPLATTTETAARTRCTSSNASLRLEFVPDGNDVLIQLFTDATADCTVEGPGKFSALPGVPSRTPRDPYANTEREFKIGAELPVAEPLVVWRWMNQCADLGPPGWRVELAGLTTTVTADIRPGCVAPGSPLTVALDSFAIIRGSQVEGEISAPGATCVGPTAGWVCEFASRTIGHVRDGDLEEIVQAGNAIEFDCTIDGNVQGAEYSTACAPNGVGDIVKAFPLALHGSAGGPRTPEDIVPELQGAIDSGDGFYLAAIGCLVNDPGCSTIVLAIDTQGAPRVVYLVFQLTQGREPAFVSAGLSGDNAEDILGGRTTMTSAGEVMFFALPPPPPGN